MRGRRWLRIPLCIVGVSRVGEGKVRGWKARRNLSLADWSKVGEKGYDADIPCSTLEIGACAFAYCYLMVLIIRIVTLLFSGSRRRERGLFNRSMADS
jgi:hypothetical protein